jgi:hypothetical protein
VSLLGLGRGVDEGVERCDECGERTRGRRDLDRGLVVREEEAEDDAPDEPA